MPQPARSLQVGLPLNETAAPMRRTGKKRFPTSLPYKVARSSRGLCTAAPGQASIQSHASQQTVNEAMRGRNMNDSEIPIRKHTARLLGVKASQREGTLLSIRTSWPTYIPKRSGGVPASVSS
jgi:hypothetical protein